jgi:hypothetical protein
MRHQERDIMSDPVNPIPPQLRGRHPDPAGTSGFVWLCLTALQADGLACVICGRNFLTEPAVSRPVGFSQVSGSQVFACKGECEAKATEPISDTEVGEDL